jgi:hypothetical protein
VMTAVEMMFRNIVQSPLESVEFGKEQVLLVQRPSV